MLDWSIFTFCSKRSIRKDNINHFKEFFQFSSIPFHLHSSIIQTKSFLCKIIATSLINFCFLWIVASLIVIRTYRYGSYCISQKLKYVQNAFRYKPRAIILFCFIFWTLPSTDLLLIINNNRHRKTIKCVRGKEKKEKCVSYLC